MICDICGNEHATWEHGIYEKLKLAEAGVPIENLFVMPNEETDDENVNEKLREVRKLLEEVE